MKKKQCLNQEHVTHLQLMIKEKHYVMTIVLFQ